MTIDEKAFEAFMISIHECGASGRGYRKALEAYEQAKKPVMGTAHVDDFGNVIVVPNSPTNTALVKRLVEAWSSEPPRNAHDNYHQVYAVNKAATLAEARAYLERQGKCGDGVVNQWKLAEWLHDFEAEVDSHGVILRPWEEQPQNIKNAYYQCAADCLELTTTSQEARRE